MAINLITQPDAATPTGNDDYTQQNILINGNINQVAPDAFILSLWESSLTVPTIKQGTYIRHAGNMYVVDSTDETISGTPAAGINYIVLAVSGTTLTATWATSYVGYTWNPAYNGWYNGTNQVIFQGVYKEGVNFISAQGVNNDPDKFRLANGDFRCLVGSVYVNNIVSANTLNATTANVTNAYLTSFKNQPNADLGIRFDNGGVDSPEAIFASAGYSDWYIDAILGRIRFVQGVTERASFAQADGSFSMSGNLAMSTDGSKLYNSSNNIIGFIGKYIEGNGISEGSFVSQMIAFLPNVNDEIEIRGTIYDGANTIIIDRIKRNYTTGITVYGFFLLTNLFGSISFSTAGPATLKIAISF